jgi:hypothetical protein
MARIVARTESQIFLASPSSDTRLTLSELPSPEQVTTETAGNRDDPSTYQRACIKRPVAAEARMLDLA